MCGTFTHVLEAVVNKDLTPSTGSEYKKKWFMGLMQTSRALYFWFTEALWPDCDVLQRCGILHCDEYCWMRDQLNSEDTLGDAVCQAFSIEGCQGEVKPLLLRISFFIMYSSTSHTLPYFWKRAKREDTFLHRGVIQRKNIITPPGGHFNWKRYQTKWISKGQLGFLFQCTWHGNMEQAHYIYRKNNKSVFALPYHLSCHFFISPHSPFLSLSISTANVLVCMMCWAGTGGDGRTLMCYAPER